MAKRRISAYIKDSTVEVIDTVGEGLSERLAAICSRYQAICQATMPAFTRAEWCAILDANNGCGADMMAAEGNPMPSGVWANVHDSPGLGDKWGIDQMALVRRMQRLNRAELLAVEEACVRFWNHTDLDTDQALAKAWANVTKEGDQ